MKKHKPRSRRHLNRPQVLVAVLLGLLILAAGYVYFHNNSAKQVTPTNTPSDNGQTVNLNPATPEEKKATEDYKKNISQPSPSTAPTTASGKKQVYPVITSASHTEINAYVSGVIEDGGSCKATATKGTQVITASSTGFANVSSTNCAPIPINLPSGEWSVIVSYSSATSEGQSQATGVN